METRYLSENEKATIYNALRVAADVYAGHAADHSGMPRLAEQFTKQKEEALALADLIEFECEDIEIS